MKDWFYPKLKNIIFNMCRLDSTRTKIGKILEKNLNMYRINQTIELPNVDDLRHYNNSVTALMEFLEEKPLYVINSSHSFVDHPKGSLVLVDPSLINCPENKFVSCSSEGFDSFYDITTKFNEIFDQNKEIFLYSIEQIRLIDPQSITPTHRYVVSYDTVDLEYWYSPTTYTEHQPLYQPLRVEWIHTITEIVKDEPTMEIVNKIKKHTL